MILSMTGYGDAECSHDGVSFALEIRSVNHRYFKATIKVADWLQSFEPQIDKLLRSKLGRGSISYHLRVRTSGSAVAGDINTEALQAYVEKLAPAAKGANTVVDLGSLITLPGVYSNPELGDEARAEYWRVTEQLTSEAMDKLLDMRRVEGEALARDLLSNCDQIRALGKLVGERAPQVIVDYQARLRSRVDQLLQDVQLKTDQNDLLREIAVFAERCDISEELVRLNCHLDQFAELCNSGQHAGRKMDFLAQEMLREVNTVGSKANDVEIAHNVVNMKSLVDRLKEQVQNVE